MGSARQHGQPSSYLSIGIIAWNEEVAIGATLDSLFQQSLFSHLGERGEGCEILCVANGCTDRTVQVASRIFGEEAKRHPFRDSFRARVAELVERGKANALNQFVHLLSAKESQFLFLMDADILIQGKDTLWNMLRVLETDPEAHIAVDKPCKDLLFKQSKSLREKISLGMSRLTLSAQAQLCGQLYAIRAEVAHNIFLPKDLTACEDGFVKTLVCTDFLAHEVWPRRLREAPEAAHIFEAYTSPKALFKNQKRQMIGQTIVHVLADQYLPQLPVEERKELAKKLSENETRDPQWLKRLIADHLRRVKFFWRLYPGLLTYRFKLFRKLNWARRIVCLPAASAGFLAALISSFAAHRFLKGGDTSYWPKAERRTGSDECRVSTLRSAATEDGASVAMTSARESLPSSSPLDPRPSTL